MQKLLYEAQSNKNIQGNCKKYKPVNPYYIHKQEEQNGQSMRSPRNNLRHTQKFPNISLVRYSSHEDSRANTKRKTSIDHTLNAQESIMKGSFKIQKKQTTQLYISQQVHLSKHLKDSSSTMSNQHQQKDMNITKITPPSFIKNRNRFMQQLKPKTFNFQQSFQVLGKLGQGKFGVVYKVKEKHTGFVFAMKVVEKENIIKKNLITQFTRELKLHMHMRHENMIQMYGIFNDSKNIYLIMEFGCDGQLYDLMKSKQEPFSELTCSFIMRNILKAVQYMHKEKIYHRDIKPENIVIVHGIAKLCDFGWAVHVEDKCELRETFCGTPLYLSPEVLSGKKYNEKVDLWAIGILAYQLLFNTSPFNITSQDELFKIITDQISYPENSRQVSREFHQFLNCILTKDPNKRLDAQHLLKLPFIVKYGQFETCEQLCR